MNDATRTSACSTWNMRWSVEQIETLTRQRDALAEACRVALDWLGDCDAGTQQAEIAEGLRAALADVERKP